MQNIIADLRAEQAALDALVSKLSPEQWLTPTPAVGWDIRDTINHLLIFDNYAFECVEGRGEPIWAELRRNAVSPGQPDLNTRLVAERRSIAPEQVLTQWRENREKLNEALLKCEPSQRILWGDGPMAARSFATARLMECWAHGLDCFAAANVQPPDTERIYHICFIGYRALPYSFRFHDRPMPASLEDLRLELTAPNGETWKIGPDSATQIITGKASEWARVAVQRMSWKNAVSLQAYGPMAEQALQLAQAYLGG